MHYLSLGKETIIAVNNINNSYLSLMSKSVLVDIIVIVASKTSLIPTYRQFPVIISCNSLCIDPSRVSPPPPPTQELPFPHPKIYRKFMRSIV
jgi:hypothetical protein